jgi:frataxin-like iron-binding protein CyaY
MNDLQKAAAEYAAQSKITKIAERVAERFKEARRGSPESMGPWDGEDHYWPDLQDFEQTDGDADRFGDFYRMEYQYVGHSGDHLTLFVKFDALQFVNSEGKKPGKWTATNFATEKTGTFRSIEDISKVLKDCIKWAEGEREKIKKDVEKAVKRPDWEAHYDGYNLVVEYKKRAGEYSDETMTVTFDDLEEAIYQGGSSSAEIWFAAGADYEGHYGEQRVTKTYSNAKDMGDILKAAEKLWDKWTKE